VLSTDDKEYGGFENVDVSARFVTTPLEWNGRKNWLQVYIPSRTSIILAKV